VGASSGATIGAIRADPELRAQLLQAMREIIAIGRAHGVALTEGDAHDAVAFIDGAPAEGTTSMQRDLAAGRPSELDAQVGAVVRLAREAGLAAPYHSRVRQALESGLASTAG
jgi:2-dehydropantoate 2-reductase